MMELFFCIIREKYRVDVNTFTYLCIAIRELYKYEKGVL